MILLGIDDPGKRRDSDPISYTLYPKCEYIGYTQELFQQAETASTWDGTCHWCSIENCDRLSTTLPTALGTVFLVALQLILIGRGIDKRYKWYRRH